MANNRLYIVDRETGEKFFLAKSYGSGGWNLPGTFKEEDLEKWLSERGDFNCAINGKAPTALVLLDEYRLEEPGMPPPPPRLSLIKCPACGAMGMEAVDG